MEAANVLGGFLCALLLTRVRIHAIHLPLALGLLLASQLAGMELSGIIGGIAIGSFLGQVPMWQELAVSVLFGLIMWLLPRFGKPIRPSIRFLAFSGLGILTLPLQTLYGGREILYGVISLALAMISAFGFRRILKTCKTIRSDRALTDTEQAAIAAAIGCILISVSNIHLYGWSLSVMLLVTLTAMAVTICGIRGTAASVLWASMTVLYAKCDPILIGSVAAASLLAVPLRSRGRMFVIISFFFSGVLFETYGSGSALSMNAQNLIFGVLFYFLIPQSWIDHLIRMTDSSSLKELTQEKTIRRIERNASEEMEQMGKLMHVLSGVFQMQDRDEDFVRQWTVHGALTICNGCEVRRICWKDAERMRKAVVQLAQDADSGKRVKPIDPIDENCRHFTDFCGSVLLSYQQALAQNAVFRHAKEQSKLVEKQFCGAGEALCKRARRIRGRERENAKGRERIYMRLTEAGIRPESIDQYDSDGVTVFDIVLNRPLEHSREAVRREVEQACGFRLRSVRMMVKKNTVRFLFEQDLPLHASMRVYRTSEKHAVSGDASGECRTAGGHVCYALSDGMGRGTKAREESEAAIEMLFRLYRAGMEKDLVYENVNRLLLANNMDEMYATLDAVSIDLNTGEAELLKYGAPPSFLLREGNIQTISGEALPCGILEEAKPSLIPIKLQPNDRLILCSDGVQDVLPEGTEHVLKEISGLNEPTGEILLKLAESRGGSDDMTVMVIRVA